LFRPADFADDTDFERFVLATLGTHRADVRRPSTTHNLRGPRNNIIVAVGAVVAGAGAREELRQSLRPLVFGAAFKVLDMLVEHVLRANGRGPGRLSFEVKRRALSGQQRPALPIALEAAPELWDRLAKLYVAFEEARHAVTHRRAQATAEGGLEVYDDGRRAVDTLTNSELEAFAAAVYLTAELVIHGQPDTRRANIVAWHCNALGARHGLPLLPVPDLLDVSRLLVMDLIPIDGGCLRFDVKRAREAVEGQVPSLWDLALYAGDRVFTGRWEDVPDHDANAFDFQASSPPAWLSEQLG
jgi:hypothetical protein